MAVKRVFTINGSPRKDYNTAQLLKAFAYGAREADSEVEVTEINLYDLRFTGCRECYACKLRDGKSYGHCGFQDDITELLHLVAHADVVAFGSPIYFSEITAQLRGFLERLWYPFVQFKRGEPQIIAPKRVQTAFLIPMNLTEQAMRAAAMKCSFSPYCNGRNMSLGISLRCSSASTPFNTATMTATGPMPGMWKPSNFVTKSSSRWICSRPASWGSPW